MVIVTANIGHSCKSSVENSFRLLWALISHGVPLPNLSWERQVLCGGFMWPDLHCMTLKTWS